MAQRGRKAIEVDKDLFQKVVTDLEKRFKFTTRSALWAAVADTGFAKSIKLSAQVAMMKAKKLDVVLLTPVGQRGRIKGQARPANAGRKAGSKKSRISLKIVEDLKRSVFNETLHKTVDKAAGGSMKAAIKLKCIDCCAGDKKEVSLCTIQLCPLWSFRPYQNKQREYQKEEGQTHDVEQLVES